MNIFALSSGKGPSGIAIVRISGPQTLDICKSLTGEKNIKSNEINLCKFIDPKNKKIGLIDLGNHILIAGVVLLGIFIISNA